MSLSVIEFLVSNWQNILITLVSGALFSIIGSLITKNNFDSAQMEKVKQANTVLLGILESELIYKRDISFERINDLIESLSRNDAANLSTITNPKFILQDLNLIVKKSHLLNWSQKEMYCKKIQEHIERINEESSEKTDLAKDYSEIIDRLSHEMEKNDYLNAQKTLNTLKNKIIADGSLQKTGVRSFFNKFWGYSHFNFKTKNGKRPN